MACWKILTPDSSKVILNIVFPTESQSYSVTKIYKSYRKMADAWQEILRKLKSTGDHMSQITAFKKYVRDTAVNESQHFKKVFVDQTYLIYSDKFRNQDFYVVSADPGNYLHLVGVQTEISANLFFDKCMTDALTEDDFSFCRNNRNIKGAVKQKLKCLPGLKELFHNSNLVFEEEFHKNIIECALAASDHKMTIGFTHSRISRPMTLLKGNFLENPTSVDLILSKKREEKSYNKIVFGNMNVLMKHMNLFSNLISDSLYEQLNIQKHIK